ncbi:putative phosphoesterase [Salirhabdus euzebyi]|uniref:Putative phosphoesterase n=1 Tax=Salirhabdus euzebyi TaxID=394506 RepID=A0A841PSM1_9BACI|nr:metallophosphoesterase family protein [Salirhabdus euzebyi]MBB6451809.1 putative phosphoesterase [Salirhabdus euzebyi]
MRKIAIMTDIHGNSAALKAVLAEIEQDPDIEHTYCLGDLIGIGHETNEVLEILFSKKHLSFVRGNHDEAILAIKNGLEPLSKGEEKKHHEWIASHINPDYLTKLSHMPLSLRSNINGVEFLFVHYHINESKEFLPIDQYPSTEKLDKLYQHSRASVICFGHHHVIHHFKSNHKLYLNPSSLGCSHKPLAPYCVIEVGEEGGIHVSFKEVPYDNKNFFLSFLQANVPAKQFILENFYGNQHLKYINE